MGFGNQPISSWKFGITQFPGRMQSLSSRVFQLVNILHHFLVDAVIQSLLNRSYCYGIIPRLPRVDFVKCLIFL